MCATIFVARETYRNKCMDSDQGVPSERRSGRFYYLTDVKCWNQFSGDAEQRAAEKGIAERHGAYDCGLLHSHLNVPPRLNRYSRLVLPDMFDSRRSLPPVQEPQELKRVSRSSAARSRQGTNSGPKHCCCWVSFSQAELWPQNTIEITSFWRLPTRVGLLFWLADALLNFACPVWHDRRKTNDDVRLRNICGYFFIQLDYHEITQSR